MNLTSERLAVLGDVTRHENTRTYEVGKRSGGACVAGAVYLHE